MEAPFGCCCSLFRCCFDSHNTKVFAGTYTKNSLLAIDLLNRHHIGSFVWMCICCVIPVCFLLVSTFLMRRCICIYFNFIFYSCALSSHTHTLIQTNKIMIVVWPCTGATALNWFDVFFSFRYSVSFSGRGLFLFLYSIFFPIVFKMPSTFRPLSNPD